MAVVTRTSFALPSTRLRNIGISKEATEYNRMCLDTHYIVKPLAASSTEKYRVKFKYLVIDGEEEMK